MCLWRRKIRSMWALVQRGWSWILHGETLSSVWGRLSPYLLPPLYLIWAWIDEAVGFSSAFAGLFIVCVAVEHYRWVRKQQPEGNSNAPPLEQKAPDPKSLYATPDWESWDRIDPLTGYHILMLWEERDPTPGNPRGPRYQSHSVLLDQAIRNERIEGNPVWLKGFNPDMNIRRDELKRYFKAEGIDIPKFLCPEGRAGKP